jgi:protein TonB
MRLDRTAYDFSASDRFGLALFASILAHMVVILGVTFSAPRIQLPGAETLEITLVQTRSDKAPDNPQFLAQANQDGGGTVDAREVARSPLPVMEMSDQNNRVPIAQPAPQQPVASLRDLVALFTRTEADRRVRDPEPQPEKKEARETPERMGLPQPRTRDTERMRLNAEIDRSFSEMQKLPRHTYINARTQEYEFATYMDGWRAKVEKVGNLNYPAEAKREQLGGSLVLDVAINLDGSVHEVQVVRPSRHRVLDDAAVRIVQLAGPFAPLPPEIRARTDVLHITRTWVFRDTDLRTE